ncbi:hypothetical protein [Singulisphaera sp. GP187]|uniref:hypothetical protein n=1 Tax=Singulisphaera sp. GP187 TaxID=1882752 RepID=UPI0009418977|nr:hypothetical protein [Singulisphaera sp. GP187]
MNALRPISDLIPVIALVLLAGCQEAASSNYQSARLEGEVTVDGQPIEDGTVQFVPANLADGPITQATIMKGRYVANKVPLGKVTAILHANPPAPPAQITSDYQTPKTVGIPNRYKTGFPIEVKENKADQDFPMSSKESGSKSPNTKQRS